MTISDWLSVVGLAVSGVGFFFTVRQLRRTATATEISNTLLKGVGERMHLNHLLVMLPQLHVISDELDAGILASDDRGVARTLVAYSRISAQIAVLLEQDSASDNVLLIARLRESASKASSVKSSIVTGSKDPLAKLVRPMMAEIAEVSNLAGALVSTYQMKVS